MKKYNITLPALNIDHCLFFRGTDAEIEEAEQKENGRAEEIKKIIFSDGFRAMEYTNYNGQRRILHHSTRPGVMFQLSYIDPDGVPAMHENYIKDTSRAPLDDSAIMDIKKLLRHYVIASNSDPLTLTIISD